jgi:serine/threonine protein kinase
MGETTMAAKRFDDRWEIVQPLTPGGQGETFIVKDLSSSESTQYVLKRWINLKRVARLEKEIEAIKSINHPNVLRLIDANLAGDRPYLVTEFCERGSLEDNKADILRMDRDGRMALFEQICKGVAAVHAANIVHRDIKPGNIFLRADGSAVVGDFGLAFIEETDRPTDTMEAVGPRWYMAPELAEGRLADVTPRADVYSLGKVLYWLLTGVVFDRERHRAGRYDLVQFYEMDKSVEHLNVLLDQMVTERPSARFQNASEVVGKLPLLRRLLRDRFPSLTAYPQLCKYCGAGMYQQLRTDPTSLRNLGFNAVSGNRLDIFRCANCGHMLMFKDAGWLELLMNTPTKIDLG